VSATSYSDDSTFLSMMAVGETLAGRSNGSGFPGTLSEGKYLIATHSPLGSESWLLANPNRRRRVPHLPKMLG
jgi:hypothetical protein